MAEKILLFGFYCATFGSVLLLCSIMQGLIRQTFWRSHKAKDQPGLDRFDSLRLTANRGFRGYDSPELFEEDLVLRIERTRQKIAHCNPKRLN